MQQTTPITTARRGTSLWAVILIAVGVIWLLGEANILAGANFSVLLRVWPLILIGFGLHMLIGRQSPTLSLLIGGSMLALIVGLMIVGPSIGLATPVEATRQSFSEPIGDARQARVELGLGVGRVNIHSLNDSPLLLDADLRHIGDITYLTSESNGRRVVVLRQSDAVSGPGFGLPVFGAPDQELFWDVALSASLPLDLVVSGGVSENTLELSALEITSFVYNAGVGRTRIALPGRTYNTSINGGVGEIDIRIGDGAAGSVNINGGIGRITLDLPDNAPIRVQVNTGLGAVNMPSFLTRVSGSDGGGVWESAAYADASANERLTIRYNGGIGELNIR